MRLQGGCSNRVQDQIWLCYMHLLSTRHGFKGRCHAPVKRYISRMDEEDELDSIAVLKIHGGDGDGAELVFDFNGQRISVSVFPSSSTHAENQGSIQDRLIALLGRLTSECLDDNRQEDLEDEVLEAILESGRLTFRAHAPLRRELGAPRDLHSVMYPPILYFQLLDNCGKASIPPIAPNEACTVRVNDVGYDSAEGDELGVDAALPSYSTREIWITEIFLEGSVHIVSRVMMNGTEMFCKAHGSPEGLAGTSIGRELDCLQKLRKCPTSGRSNEVRIPEILGYVRHADTNRIISFLREWVPGRPLEDIDIPEFPAEQRRKWIAQIRQAVQELHTRGLTWGNGKAANIIIDEQGGAWLIDFGGGWTGEWVDEDLTDTVKGDEQALNKIEEFLEAG